MANTLLTPTIIAKTALAILENNLVLANLIHRDDQAFEVMKIGTQHTIRLPNRFTVNTGRALNVADLSEPSAIITIDTQKHVDFYHNSDALTLTVEEYADRYLKPAMSQLANEVEVAIAGLYSEFYHSVGTPGTAPDSYAESVQLCSARADLMGWPMEGRALVMAPDDYHALAGGLTSLNYLTDQSRETLQRGMIPTLGGWPIYESQNIVNHTVGTYGGTPLTEAAGANGDTTTDSDGWSSGATTLNVGDVLTIAGVNAVNPQTRTSAGFLQQFSVQTQISDTSGDIDFEHAPTITTSGAYQNVDAAPANDQTITVLGTSATAYPQHLFFHRDAMSLAMADMVLPQGVDFAARARYKGIAVRVVRAYDINSDSFPIRIDILFGVKAIDPQRGGRLWGA